MFDHLERAARFHEAFEDELFWLVNSGNATQVISRYMARVGVGRADAKMAVAEIHRRRSLSDLSYLQAEMTALLTPSAKKPDRTVRSSRQWARNEWLSTTSVSLAYALPQISTRLG